MRNGRLAKVVALVLVASIGWVSSGCFGKFQLTRKVYDINQSVDDKYVRSAVTWVLLIVPVYEVAAFLDFILFNVIEFWSGQNPVASGKTTKTYARGDEKMVLALAREGGATVATIERFKAGALVSTMTLRDDGRGTVASFLSEGGAVTRERTARLLEDGSAEVTSVSDDGTVRETYAPSAVATFLARASRAAEEVRHAVAGGSGGTIARPARLPSLQG